jgi:N-acetyl-gamma-glutamyl-phosphate/LysW-gamma-L-alpha-aminoadipyl-6-phosphate reductase
MTKKISIVGGSGYIGGELLRILAGHQDIELVSVSSDRYAGKPLARVHPALRGRTDLQFVKRSDVNDDCDLLFLSVPHGTSQELVKSYHESGIKLIDMSADFRLNDRTRYPQWYGWEHSCPELLELFVYGLPEINRDDLTRTSYAAGPGCVATSAILPLWPLIKNNMIDTDRIIVDAKIGSSAAGIEPSLSSHHPERSGAVRPYAPTMHRHTAEIEEVAGSGRLITLSLTVHAIEMVRGIASTTHVFLKDEGTDNKTVWKAYREVYGDEPFVRIVKERKGLYRYPEPKMVAGTNFCDIGFEVDEHSNRLVVFSAIDNLMKGGAGSGVQSMNLMFGLDEAAGLDRFSALHP